MKKILVTLIALFGLLNVYADKAIYYPIYIANVEVYNGDSLVLNENIIAKNSIMINMLQSDVSICITTPNINDIVKKSIKLRRASNLSGVNGALSLMNSGLSTMNGYRSNNIILASLYFNQSYFYATNAYRQFEMMSYLKDKSDDALTIPIKCTVSNNTDEILRGNIIVKPKEKLELKTTNYYDEWRISDNNNNVYCIRFFAIVVREHGYISRKENVAYVNMNCGEYENGYITKEKYKRINLEDYSTKIVGDTDEEFLRIKKMYKKDRGYDK